MAKLLHGGRVCDGWDYLVKLADGSVQMLHFVEEPKDVAAACDALEAELLEAFESRYIVIGEDGAIID